MDSADLSERSPHDDVGGGLSEHARTRLGDLERDHAIALARLAQREAELAALRMRIEIMRQDQHDAVDGLEQALVDAEELTAEVRRQSEARVARLQSSHEQLERDRRASAGRIAELEQLVTSLLAALGTARDDMERAAASRAWRYGHRLMRAASRATLRKPRTDGALLAGARRIEQLHRAMSTSPTDPSSSTSLESRAPSAAHADASEA